MQEKLASNNRKKSESSNLISSVFTVYLGDKAQGQSSSTCSCSTTNTMNIISWKPADE